MGIETTIRNVVHRFQFQFQFQFNKAMFAYRYTHLLIPTKWLCRWVCFCSYICLTSLQILIIWILFPFACIELMLFVNDIRHIYRIHCCCCVCLCVKRGVFHSTSMIWMNRRWSWWPKTLSFVTFCQSTHNLKTFLALTFAFQTTPISTLLPTFAKVFANI